MFLFLFSFFRMLTKLWGAAMWHSLHCISFNYPVHPTREDKIHYRNFIQSLKYVLPCGICRNNLSDNFKKLPLNMSDMKSRDSFSKYVFNLRELINTMLNKKSGLTFEEVRDRYEHFRSRCGKVKTPKKKTEVGCIDPMHTSKKNKMCFENCPNRSEM